LNNKHANENDKFTVGVMFSGLEAVGNCTIRNGVARIKTL